MSAGGLFAKIDLDLRDHPRARAAGSAMATWTWALTYIRAHGLDGFIPRDAIGASWVGERQGLKDAAKLCSEKVGLFAEVDGGWKLLKYEEKNDGKTTIDGRREAARIRMANKRAALKAAKSSQDVRTEFVRTAGEQTAHGSQTVRVSDSLSDLGSGSSLSSGLSSDRPESLPCPEPDPLTSPPGWRAEVVAGLDMSMGRKPVDEPQCWARFVTTSQRDSRAITPEAWRAFVVLQLGYDQKDARRLRHGRIVQRDPPGPRAFEVDDGNHDYEALARQGAAQKGTGT